jgi:hypothetical protein
MKNTLIDGNIITRDLASSRPVVKRGRRMKVKGGTWFLANTAKALSAGTKHGRRTRVLRVKKVVQAPENEFGFAVDRFVEHISTYKDEVLDAVFTAQPESELVPQELGFIKATYRNETVDAVSYNLLMPTKQSYKVVLNLILDAFMTKEGAAGIPAVKVYLGWHPEETEALVGTLMDIVTGSSRFDVNGRYYSLDEKSQVVQVIVTDPRSNGGMRESFHALATAVITHLISGRFAHHTGQEQEVWVTESQIRIHKTIRVSTDSETTGEAARAG